MRANKWTLFLTAAVCLLLAGSAFGQQTPVVVSTADGQPLPDATVTSYVNGAGTVATTNGNSTFFVQNAGERAVLLVEHPAYGSRHVEVDLPNSDGTIAVFLKEDGAEAKFLDHSLLRDFFVQAEPGQNPIIPPPGQGCQLPDQLGHGSGGIVAATSDAEAGFIVADCFCPTEDGFLTHAVWWGIYFDFGFGIPCDPSVDDFTITYYLDGGAGVPGAQIASFSVGLAQKFATGNLLIGVIPEYQFQSTFHAPVPVSAGQCYWIEILNNTVGDGNPLCLWLWDTAPPGDGASAQFNGAYAPTDFDQAFCVSLQIAADGCGVAPGPANDECSGCDVIAGEGTFPFDNSSATTGVDGQGNVLCDFFGSTAIDNDLWYCWTAPCDADVLVQTCGLTSVDTKIAIYDGTACPPGAAIACNDDACAFQSGVTFTAVAGNSYLIQLGTFPGATGGAGAFDISCTAGPPANDDCTGAVPVTIGSTTAGDTTSAGVDAAPFCGVSPTSPGVWYSVIGDGTRLSADLCNGTANWDSKLTVYCGGCGVLNCIDGNDDFCSLQSAVEWDTTAGTEYLILVHGFGGASGPFDLIVASVGANTGTPIACSVPLTASLGVNANIPNVFIQVTPMDVYGNGAGLTPFSRTYGPETLVQITAPTQWDGKDLAGWLVNGRVLKANQGTIQGRLTRLSKVKAIYGDRDTTPSGDVLHH